MVNGRRSDTELWFALRMEHARRGDVSLTHPEKYFDTPGFGDQLSQPVMETRDTMEGEDRFQDLDGAEPLGRPSDMVPGLSGEMFDGDEGTLEGQTGTGFHQHEAAAMGPLGQQLLMLRPQLATAAQRVLDAWQPDENGEDVELGGGGACDFICRAMSDVLSGIDANITEGGQEGDDHAYLIIYDEAEAYEVDIPPNRYETGGGYSWQKLPDVQLSVEDVVVAPIPRDWIEDGMDFDADYGADLSMMSGPAREDTPLSTSPSDPTDLMGRNAGSIIVRARQGLQEVATVGGRKPHDE